MSVLGSWVGAKWVSIDVEDVVLWAPRPRGRGCFRVWEEGRGPMREVKGSESEAEEGDEGWEALEVLGKLGGG